MEENSIVFDEKSALQHLRHYLPEQAALKDFVHHNTLHAFQHQHFHTALNTASQIFGYSTYLSLEEYRSFYKKGKIREDILDRVIAEYTNDQNNQYLHHQWKEKLLHSDYNTEITSRTGRLRFLWKQEYGINMNKVVHPLLFRLTASFLDQGISLWKFPLRNKGFLNAIRELNQNGITSLFHSERAGKLLNDKNTTLTDLLGILIGKEELFEQYLFDQQFAHPGWSGFVSVAEQNPSTLLSERRITLGEFIFLELLLEIDALDHKLGNNWIPPGEKIISPPEPLFEPVPHSELQDVLRLWQEAFEWSYFDDVLAGLKLSEHENLNKEKSFQGLFCIDDREYSFRRHIGNVDPLSETFGTPGFFGVEFYYLPENGKFYTKACPAPVNPSFLIKEKGRKSGHRRDPHFARTSHSLLRGWIITGTLGFWSALKLFANIFRPSLSPATAYSFGHMDRHAALLIESTGQRENGLHVGFTIPEMSERVKKVLKSIGLTRDFAPIVYVIGHGGSSVNNTYYAGYDCGACCGRPGAVNARVFSYMANKKEVRSHLSDEGIKIPGETLFIGAMHDTTRDEIEFYDENISSASLLSLHETNKKIFRKALELNAIERSFRFETVNSTLSPSKLHEEIKKRSVSLFEPRPEWNHTANALCIVGRKQLYENLYLDKRPFLNSYDYSQDPDGEYLKLILSAAIPVCGGINLEYYFSRVDQQNLGSGTKLPHNVVGLFAVANGIDGDLRPGLPSQMIEIHDPVRILFIIEQTAETVLKIIESDPNILEWIKNHWVLLSVKDPYTGELFRYGKDGFEHYVPLRKRLRVASDEKEIPDHPAEDSPVFITC